MSKTRDDRQVDGKQAWRSPEIKEIGNVHTLVQALNPGKPSFGVDGGGVGGGEEMFMT